MKRINPRSGQNFFLRERILAIFILNLELATRMIKLPWLVSAFFGAFGRDSTGSRIVLFILIRFVSDGGTASFGGNRGFFDVYSCDIPKYYRAFVVNDNDPSKLASHISLASLSFVTMEAAKIVSAAHTLYSMKGEFYRYWLFVVLQEPFFKARVASRRSTIIRTGNEVGL